MPTSPISAVGPRFGSIPTAAAVSASASGAAVAAAATSAPRFRNSLRGIPVSMLSISASRSRTVPPSHSEHRREDARRDPLGSWTVKGASLAAGGLLALLTVSASVRAGSTGAQACATPRASAAYTARIERALRSGPDAWGNALVAAPGGPSYAAAKRHVEPLLYARTSGGRTLTESGVYYLPFAQPLGAQGAGSVQLHVADGGQILAERAGGPSVRIGVGAGGRERYGSCLERLAPARLGGGWLPVLETSYRDAAGVRYRQESFAARSGGSLASYVRIAADAPAAAGGAVVRLASTRGRSLAFRVPVGTSRTVWAAWSRAAGARVVTEADYDAAKQTIATYWRARLTEGATFRVPEARMMNAERAVLVQNLALTWRYSIGNPYEEFSFPESVD